MALTGKIFIFTDEQDTCVTLIKADDAGEALEKYAEEGDIVIDDLVVDDESGELVGGLSCVELTDDEFDARGIFGVVTW